MEYVAHIRKYDKEEQSLESHLLNVAKLAGENARKLGMADAGELIGLLHDIGKYSEAFQDYIRANIQDQDSDSDLKGKIDHSTSGAQYLFEKLFSNNEFFSKDGKKNCVAKLLSLCLVSHHSGLIDCLSSLGVDVFEKRIKKQKNLTHYDEIILKMDAKIKNKIDEIVNKSSFIDNIFERIFSIKENEEKNYSKNQAKLRMTFKIGLLARILFSCLVDADHTDTADFENPRSAAKRLKGDYQDWDTLSQRLEDYLINFNNSCNAIDNIRAKISEEAKEKAKTSEGKIFSLTVPTGGGKTLASLRFALNYAKNAKNAKNSEKIERIIYVIPFTSIIDQNAQVARNILEPSELDAEKIVLEHHSNITGEKDEKNTWQNKILCENWDAPVIFTTMVQFLDAMFSGSTRDVRRMHKLANSVIIFDEIQLLPVRCVHMFCNAINFLADSCNSKIVLCTATQPLLDEVDEKGKLKDITEIAPNVRKLFEELKRVEIKDLTKNKGWECDALACLAMEKQKEFTSCLVIVNTTKAAREIYKEIKIRDNNIEIFHLSSQMCSIHRVETLTKIRDALKNKTPLICVSTQVIEAGVDVDFGSAIRSIAGLDSIAQAAGRCNRNGENKLGFLYVVNLNDDLENVSRLKDISIGQGHTKRILREILKDKDMMDIDVMKLYYKYYFYDRKDDMDYPIEIKDIGRNDALLNLLSVNENAAHCYHKANNNTAVPANIFSQSFKAAGSLFRSIDSDTKGIVVPYGTRGKELIAELCSDLQKKDFYRLLREAQKYTVNVYNSKLIKLDEINAVYSISENGILYLNESYYSNHFGLCEEIVDEPEILIA